jgi:hypothetical protein
VKLGRFVLRAYSNGWKEALLNPACTGALSAGMSRRYRINDYDPARGRRPDNRESAREAAPNMVDWRDRSKNRSGPMTAAKQLKAPTLARRASKGPRSKRTRPEPRQYTVADLERARDRVGAAERRIDNDRTNNPNRGRAGLERAQLELHVIESQLRLRGLLE